MSDLVITTAGLAAASVATPTGPYIHIVKFRLGDDYTTPAQVTDTDIVGAMVYEGTAVSYNYYSTDTVQVNLEIPAEAGPFGYGELGVYLEDDVLFGRFSFGAIRTKLPSTLSGYANILRIKVLIKLVGQGPAVFQIENLGEQDVLEIDTLMTLQPPGDHPEVPMAIVHEPNDYQESVLLYKHDETFWNPVNYLRIGSPTIDAATDTTITSAFMSSFTMAPSGELGRYMVQIEGGFLRFIESIAGDVITLAQPLDTAPSVLGQFILYELVTSHSNGSGFAGYPAVTTIPDFTRTQASPVNGNGDTFDQFPTNTASYNTAASNCYMTFKVQTTSYFDGSASGQPGHIVFGTRFESVGPLPRGSAVLLARGEPAVDAAATANVPSAQLEEISPGTSPAGRRFLWPGTDIPYKSSTDQDNASVEQFGITDDVLYKVELWTRNFREGICTSRFKLYEQSANGYDWDLLRDTGDVVVNQDDVLDFTASDVFFAEVASPGGSWSIAYSDIRVVWTPNASTVGVDLTNVLQRTGGTIKGVFKAEDFTLFDFGSDFNRIKINNTLHDPGGEGGGVDARRWTAFINADTAAGTSVVATSNSKDLSDNGTGANNKKAANFSAINQHIDYLYEERPYYLVSYGTRHFQIHTSIAAKSYGQILSFPAFGHPDTSMVVSIVHSTAGLIHHEFNEKGLRLRANESSTMVAPNGRALGDPSLRMRGIENTGGVNAAGFAPNTIDPPFDLDAFCAIGALGAYLGATPSGAQIEQALRPLYCMVSNIMREMRETKILATAESGNN